MFQCCIRTLKFVNDKVKINVSGKQIIHLFVCKHNVKSLCTKIHHELGSNKETSESNKNIDCLLPKETNAENSIQNTEFVKSQTTNKFKIKENLQSFPISGSEITDDYRILYEGTDKNLYVPSVTRILNQTISPKSKQALLIWKNNIIDEFGEKHFDELVKGLLNNGRLFHSCIQNTLQGKENVEISPNVESAYSSVQPVLNEITSVKATETHVMHPMLRYKGIVDCVACYRNEIYVIDWKKSDKPKKTLTDTYDAPLQIAAYIGAINASQQYPLPIDKGLVVVGYTNGDAATVHVLKENKLQTAWKEWLKRLEQYYTSLNKKQEEK